MLQASREALPHGWLTSPGIAPEARQLLLHEARGFGRVDAGLRVSGAGTGCTAVPSSRPR